MQQLYFDGNTVNKYLCYPDKKHRWNTGGQTSSKRTNAHHIPSIIINRVVVISQAQTGRAKWNNIRHVIVINDIYIYISTCLLETTSVRALKKYSID